MNQSAPLWNSLEITKLIISAITPLIVLIIGWWINRSLKRFEYFQWANQKVVEKRLSVFDELAPLLNDLLCYFTFIGCWKDLTPLEVIQLKRKIDRIAHINAPLFSKEFINRYYDFVNLCYSTYSGWGEDAKLLTFSERRKAAAGALWDVKWTDCFANKSDCPDPQAVKSAYIALMSCFSKEIGVGLDPGQAPLGRIPANIE